MPSSRTTIISALAAAALTCTTNAAFGPAFSTGPVADGSWIRESTSTLVLPKVPNNNKGDASLWVGMGTSNGDLIQSIAENYNADNWSIYAYTLLSTSPTTQMPVQAPGDTAVEGDHITMHYTFDDATGNYTQIVSVNGQQVSTLSTSDGHALGWGSAVECAEENCGTVPAHSWVDTKIVLNSADPNYSQTLGKAAGVTGEMSTSDGGVTWTVSTIEIPEFTFGS
ncbi:hypothetical protein K458DRAFT_313717 [Lentithecium fluviatile CBS 122367]|uniref:Concanavalin A-like lectin/glucanase n=1 Tax=Lentithecium fluviatile CBS 122367 TaxID=1168545 RepID=A0A6G1INE2_9PLEO|nr:hypothetical protein K458DRAFT_313717 [Lentithecium fluviatile CBS 122367]